MQAGRQLPSHGSTWMVTVVPESFFLMPRVTASDNWWDASTERSLSATR